MSGDTKIEWADRVWNPITGCTRVSEGCKNCYAERMSKRLAGRYGYPADDPFSVTLHHNRLKEPLKWRKPQRIFVCSMGDLFHKDVSSQDLVNIFKVMAVSAESKIGSTFLVLTKRPKRMQEFATCCKDLMSRIGDNVHLGVSVEDQATADERIPLLLNTPAAKRFVSLEPMLGPVDLTKVRYTQKTHLDVLRGWEYDTATRVRIGKPFSRNALDQVILGGESGPGARPIHPDWARKVRDDCKAAGVPFLFKQWGEWAQDRQHGLVASGVKYHRFNDGTLVEKVGKKAAGCLFDGVEHKEVCE